MRQPLIFNRKVEQMFKFLLQRLWCCDILILQIYACKNELKRTQDRRIFIIDV